MADRLSLSAVYAIINDTGAKIYGSFKPTAYPVDYKNLEEAARKKLPVENYNYVAGSAGSYEDTARANREAFDDYHIIPSMLRDTNKRSTEVTLFGQKHASPILLAPVGVQGIMHPEAEEATARAAESAGVAMVVSTAATRSMEKIAAANGDGHRWYQLYW
jgi:lactate 2-monooxygenase